MKKACLVLAAVVVAVFLGWRFNIGDTLVGLFHIKGARPASIELGSCYAYEYGYDVPQIMEYVPYRKDRPFQITGNTEKALWLAVANKEVSESLEEGSLYVTFPEAIRVRQGRGWVCLGTGSNACYIDFNRSLHLNNELCLEPLFVTLNTTGPLKVEYSISTKDHQATKGNFELSLR